MNKMIRLILKILLILACGNINAESESIDSAVNTGLESVEVVATNSEKDILPEESGVIEDEVLTEETLDEEQLQPYGEIVLTKDVVLILDNSGSMKKNDPDFLVSKAVKEFIRQQDKNTRVGIVIFDQDARLSVSLTDTSIANREIILNSIEEINYKGLFTDSPAGIERAIYELKNNGRDNAQKSIIFMTDGIVDTGNADVDLEQSKWLKDSLAPDAADNHIKIFGIAFIEAADFRLIRSIAQRTDGEYYRALTAEDLPSVFEQINKIINTVSGPDFKSDPESDPEFTSVIETPAPVIQQAPASPVIIELPVQKWVRKNVLVR